MVSLFTACCWDGDVEYVRYALLNGQDPNERDEDDGCTGLMHAVQNKENEILELLLEQPEIDINSVNEIGDTALHVAGYYGNLWAVKKLVSDPRIKTLNSRNNDGKTPLLEAVMMGNVDCVRELVKFPEINLFGCCPKGRTLLGNAVMSAVIDDDNAIVELLLKQPELDINSVNEIGDTALHVAGYSGNLWAVKKLVSDPRIKTLNSRNNDGQTPLIGAVRMGDVDCVRELVKIPGVDLHKISPQGRTLEEMVCEACDENEPKVIEKKAEIVSMIKNARLQKNKVFVQYCLNGKVEEAKQALIDGQDPNEKAEEYHSCSPLALAVIMKQNAIVELLLEQPQTDLNCADNNGDTALHDACFINNPLAVANLGRDPRIRKVNSRNKNGVTPLMHAVRKGNVDCVREVVKLPGINLSMSYLSKDKTKEITLEDITCELLKSKKKEIKGNILSLLQNARHARHVAYMALGKCEYCDYTSDKRSNLDKHVKETHNKLEQKPLCCNHCDYTTVRQGDLKKHIKETHEKLEQKLLHCNHCDYTTVRQGDLKKHIKETHEKLEQQLLHCNHCDYTNVRQGNLNRHMLTHTNKVHKIGKFKCDKCDFSDDEKKRLTQHLKRKHPMVENVFECR